MHLLLETRIDNTISPAPLLGVDIASCRFAHSRTEKAAPRKSKPHLTIFNSNSHRLYDPPIPRLPLKNLPDMPGHECGLGIIGCALCGSQWFSMVGTQPFGEAVGAVPGPMTGCGGRGRRWRRPCQRVGDSPHYSESSLSYQRRSARLFTLGAIHFTQVNGGAP